MTVAGIGPKLALLSLPYLAFTIFLTIKFKYAVNIASLTKIPKDIIIIAGLILLVIGIVFYITTAMTFLRDFKKGILMKTCTYALSRNPIYASFIIFFVPAIALILNSWVILTVSLQAYIIFKLFISEEVTLLEKNFGDEYLEYKKKVNELFPFYRR